MFSAVLFTAHQEVEPDRCLSSDDSTAKRRHTYTMEFFIRMGRKVKFVKKHMGPENIILNKSLGLKFSNHTGSLSNMWILTYLSGGVCW